MISDFKINMWPAFYKMNKRTANRTHMILDIIMSVHVISHQRASRRLIITTRPGALQGVSWKNKIINLFSIASKKNIAQSLAQKLNEMKMF